MHSYAFIILNLSKPCLETHTHTHTCGGEMRNIFISALEGVEKVGYVIRPISETNQWTYYMICSSSARWPVTAMLWRFPLNTGHHNEMHLTEMKSCMNVSDVVQHLHQIMSV